MIMGNIESASSHWLEVEVRTKLQIKEILTSLKKRKKKITFNNVTELAVYIANEINKKHKTKIAWTTLTRSRKKKANPYKLMLVDFLAHNTKSTAIEISNARDLENKLFDTELALANAKREIQQLKTYISTIPQGQINHPILPSGSTDWKESFIQLGRLISAISKYFNGEIEFNKESMSLIDLASEKTIIKGKPVRTFIEWLDKNSKLHGDFDSSC